MDIENKTKKRPRSAGRLFLKSALWTLIALSLICIGYFGADALFGSLQ